MLPAQQLEPTSDGLARVRCGDFSVEGRNHHGLPANSACYVCVRPHDLHFKPRAEKSNCVTGVVQSVQWLGELHSIVLDVGGEVLRLTRAPLESPPEPGTALSEFAQPPLRLLIGQRAPVRQRTTVRMCSRAASLSARSFANRTASCAEADPS